MVTACIIFASAIAVMDRDPATPPPIARATGEQIERRSLGAIDRAEPCAARPALYSIGV